MGATYENQLQPGFNRLEWRPSLVTRLPREGSSMRTACLLLLIASVGSPLGAWGQESKWVSSPAAAPKRVVDLRHMSCAQYTALPEADRPPVVWYIAGYYKAAGDFMERFDLDVASGAVSATAKHCAEKPSASLRYTVGQVFAALREEIGPKQ